MFKKIAILSIGMIFGIYAQNEPLMAKKAESLSQRIGRFATEKKTQFSAQIKKLDNAVEYLKKSRDCLSGIGCSKNQSYFANYTLGAAMGTIGALATWATFPIITGDTAENIMENARRAQEAIRTGTAESFISESKATQQDVNRASSIIVKVGFLNFLIEELGYRHLVHEQVHLWKCITFRGCSDQTKRYGFYRLGLLSGNILGSFAFEKAFGGHLRKKNIEQIEREARQINITDNEIKKKLSLNEEKQWFEWYEVLGVDRNTPLDDARKAFKRLSLKYHPDRNKDPLAQAIFQYLKEAEGKINPSNGIPKEEQSTSQPTHPATSTTGAEELD